MRASHLILAVVLVGLLPGLAFAGSPIDLSSVNYGLRFDGVDDVLRQGACIDVGSDAPFTLEMWSYPISGGEVLQLMASSRGFSFYIHTSGMLVLNIASPGSSAAPSCCHLGAFSTYTQYRSTATVTKDTWTHVALVWDGIQPVVYINGIPDTMVFSMTQYSFTCCVFGQDSNCFSRYRLHMTLDEVRVWNRARSGQEIVNDMFRELSGTEVGLIHYWPMNDGQGQTTSDQAASNTLMLGTTPTPDVHDPTWVLTGWDTTVLIESSTWSNIKALFKDSTGGERP